MCCIAVVFRIKLLRSKMVDISCSKSVSSENWSTYSEREKCIGSFKNCRRGEIEKEDKEEEE